MRNAVLILAFSARRRSHAPGGADYAAEETLAVRASYGGAFAGAARRGS